MEEKILKDLREQGYRVTKVRREMIMMLANAKAPLAASDMLKSLEKKSPAVNKTTVYRELDFLRENNIVQEVEFGDKKKRYEISDRHHHHVVCLECKKVEDVDLQSDLEAQEKKIGRQKNFKVLNHSLEFFGLCADCK